MDYKKLPNANVPPGQTKKRSTFIRVLLFFTILSTICYTFSHHNNKPTKDLKKYKPNQNLDDELKINQSKYLSNSFFSTLEKLQKKEQICPQISAKFPPSNDKVDKVLEEWRKDNGVSIERFQAGIKIQTESFDDMRDNRVPHTDPRYKSYTQFIDFLEKRYPKLHTGLKRKLVNDYGLVFVWEGSDAQLAPIMLCAHYDVVPVNPMTWDEWKYPPFSGYNDGTYIWGRGTSDTKGTLFSILESIELLLTAEFQPSRGVILAFGFDEEISGYGGAKFIGEYIEKELGLANGIEFLVDEGTSFAVYGNTKFGVVAVAEKGYVDLQYTVSVPGGHSSVPPDNTGIGMMSGLIEDFEEHPFRSELRQDSSFLKLLQCVAEYSEDLDPFLRFAIKNIKNPWLKESVIEILSENPRYRYQMTSSQAVDIIHGGVKVNALPEVTTAMINYRIALHSKFEELFEHIYIIAEREAEYFNLTLTIQDKASTLSPNFKKQYRIIESAPGVLSKKTTEARFGTLLIEIPENVLEVAPLTPSFGDEKWEILSGTIKSVFGDMFVAPSVMSGNSDTRHYWGLTKSIFRFSPIREGRGIHTINEHVSIQSILKAIEFYVALIRNVN